MTYPDNDPVDPGASWKDGSGYDIILLLGQSNMQGDSSGAVAPIDASDSRIYSFGATGTYGNQITLAADPLAHRGGGSTVVGPGMSFARWYLGTIPAHRRVLLVPAAANGTAFGSGTQRWDPTTSQPADGNSLYNLAIAQALMAINAAGQNSRFAAALWVQGESDALAGMSATTYRTYLEQLIDGLRSRLSRADLPFVIGSMTPEFIATNGSAASAIDGVHRAIPTRKAFTAYVAGPSGMGRGDNLHYSPAGQREVGRRLAAGIATAQANGLPTSYQGESAPTPPTTAMILENFNQDDGSITAADTGQTLTSVGGQWRVVSNQAAPASGTSAHTLLLGDVGSTTHSAQAVVATSVNGSGVVVRAVDINNFYVLAALSDGYHLYKMVSGTLTEILSKVGTVTAGDTMKLKVSGSTLTAYINGSQIAQWTDSALSSGTKAGLWANQATARMDDMILGG